LSSWLSPCLAERIVCCSLVSYKFHLVLGYAAEKLLYIPNGFDTERFRPDPASRVSVRSELGLPPETRLIGYVARYDPQKDHDTFLAAARKLAATDPDTHFVLCGSEITPHNTDLVAAIRRHGIADRCHLLGMREDMPRITASLDLATTASAYGEAFPLVIGEAMACGVPCVVTEVGDSPLIVGETGAAIPPRDPDALSDGWRRLLSLSAEARKVMGERARTRIIEDFSLRQTTRAYEDLYMSVVSAAA
jgi:glycosyltransferase involved in cell wall biosynthesis